MLDRNFTKFILLTPGTQQLQWQHAASENPQGSTQTMVNGQHFSGTGYQLDGTENRDPILGIIVINPTLESIGETKITSQNYDAEFGQATAGVVSVQTRSGTQHAARQRLRVLPERRAAGAQPVHAVPDRSADRPLHSRDQAQPVRRVGRRADRANRWFFFGDYQGTRDTQGGSRAADGPDRRRRARGDLSAYGVNIYDPADRPAVRRQRAFRAARLSQQALRILEPDSDSRTPPGRDNGTRDNYVAAGIENFDENSFERPRSTAGCQRQHQHVRPLQPRRLLPRRPDRLRRRAAARSWSAWAACPT